MTAWRLRKINSRLTPAQKDKRLLNLQWRDWGRNPYQGSTYSVDRPHPQITLASLTAMVAALQPLPPRPYSPLSPTGMMSIEDGFERPFTRHSLERLYLPRVGKEQEFSRPVP